MGIALLSSMAVAGWTVITVAGSDTLVLLGQRWAEEYNKKNREVLIQVTGGGSVAGIQALMNGTADICEASRDLNDSELKLAREKGISPYQVPVALDGVAIYLNTENPVRELSFEQLRGIYTGKVTNWSEVGGKDAQIVTYGRESTSGTFYFFREHVLNGSSYSTGVQRLPGTGAVVNAVDKDIDGIGYGGLSWASGVKYAAVKLSDSVVAVVPDKKSITDGSYPISRELYWFFNGEPKAKIREFVEWALSDVGQELAEKLGYVALPENRRGIWPDSTSQSSP